MTEWPSSQDVPQDDLTSFCVQIRTTKYEEYIREAFQRATRPRIGPPLQLENGLETHQFDLVSSQLPLYWPKKPTKQQSI